MKNPVQIPDAAVQAAMDVTEGNVPPIMLERALTAALSYLQPVDVAAVLETGFREGLEVAAKWHEEHAFGYETEYSNLNIADELAAEHRGSATAIRALSAEPAARAALAQGGGE